MDIIDNPALMNPLFPPDGQITLENLSFDLIKEASSLAAQLPIQVAQSIGALVRSMNCYYSNLIEGHNTHPVDIERALKNSYSNDPLKRTLQKEAYAHIAVQTIIDQQTLPSSICSKDFLCWIHKEFYARLPQDLLEVKDPTSSKIYLVKAGELRSNDVTIGQHLAPVYSKLPEFLVRFQEHYESPHLSKIQKIIAVAASHHRILWIHPFLDGNGRVARLFSHAFLKHVGIGSSLWSVSRGLARASHKYKILLSEADNWRQGDHDGRGSLSQQGLLNFCEFFLQTCLDQIKFMTHLLEPNQLLTRIKRFCDEEEQLGHLQKGAFQVLREIILAGELQRGQVKDVTGYKDRQSRNIVKSLQTQNLLISDSTRSAFNLHIPHHVVERWFPKLYPADTLVLQDQSKNLL